MNKPLNGLPPVGLIGLGAMGLGMATSLRRAGKILRGSDLGSR